jgi:ribonuclease-3
MTSAVSDEVDEPMAETLARLEAILGHRFARPELLTTALRHASYAHEAGLAESNERLEFLGDAVLGLIVADALYASHPHWREGELTRALHAVVEARALARLAREIDLGAALALGRTERASGGEAKASILADGMEAVVGALFLDGGLEAVRRFVQARFAQALSRDSAPVARDPKTELQEQTMAEVGVFPSYRVVADSGIEGDDRRFTVEVSLAGEALARAIDRTKRAAEREAAREALARRAAAASATLAAEG